MAVDVADLVAHLGLEAAPFERGMAKAEGRLSQGAGTMRAHLATVGTAAMSVGLGLGGALAGGLMAVVGPAATFEKTMSGVKAVSGASAVQMKQLSTLALQLGKDTTFSASEAASGIEELVKGGVSIQDIMHGAATATLNLAAAGGVDLPTAAEIAANAMNMFGIQGRKMARVSDLIAGAANASSLDVTDFKFSLGAAGAVAHTIGFSFDDLAVAIAEMGAAGIKGSDAGTSLKTMMLNLTPQTDKAAGMMKQLGIITATGANQFFDASGKVRSLADVQGVLQTALKGLSKEQQITALHVLFGTDAIRAASVMAGQGTAGFNKMAAAMGKVTAASVAATRLQNLSGQIEQLKGSVETLEIAIGTALIPRLTKLATTATNVVNKILEFTQKLPPNFIETATTLGTIGATALTVGGAATKLVALMNPVTLTIAAIVAAGVLLYKGWTEDWGGIREKTAAAWTAIQPVLRALQAAITTVMDVFSGKATHATGTVHDLAVGAGTAFAAIRTALQQAWAYIQPTLSAWGTQIQDLVRMILPSVGPAMRNVQAAITTIMRVITTYWRGAWDGIKEELAGAWQILKSIVTGGMAILANSIKLVLDVISGNWRGAGIDIQNIVKAWWGLIVGVAKGGMMMVEGAIRGLIGGLVAVFRDMGIQIIEGMKAGILSMAGSLKDAVVSTVTAPLDAVKDKLGIHSPSRVFHELGQQTMAGYALGIGAGADGVNAALARALQFSAPRLPAPAWGGPGPGMAAMPMPLALGAGGGTLGMGAVNITVNVSRDGQVSVAGGGLGADRDLGRRIGRAVFAELESAARTVTPPAPRMQPGARAS